MTISNSKQNFIASIKEKIRLAQYEALNEYHVVEFLRPLIAEIQLDKARCH